MPEIIRAIAGRLREFVGNRRRAKRYQARLPVAVCLIDAKAVRANDDERKRSAALEGHTLDISATGLALALPAIRIGEHYLTNQDRHLEINIELAAGQTLSVRARVVRYERLDGEAGEMIYLLGVHLLEVGDQLQFAAYLQTLARGDVK
ncbi:MAG: PilZ domain-containing protein [Pyrinomonadaceae bacterium]